MRTEVGRADLARVLSAISRVVEARSTIPILANVLLTLDGSVLRARGTDLSIEVSAEITATGEPGSACVPAKSLADICKRLVGDTVTLDLEPGEDGAGTLIVKAGRSRFKLPSFKHAAFPTLDGADMPCAFRADLGALFGPVASAVAIDDAHQRHFLEGVFIESADDRLVAVGSDGKRLARYSIALPEGADGVAGAIIPKKVADLICGMKAGEVDVEIGPTRIAIKTPDHRLVSKLIEGDYVDYERFLGIENNRSIPVVKADLAAALGRVGLVASENNGRAVRLNIAPGGIQLVVRDADGRETTDEVATPFAGEPTFTGFTIPNLDLMLAAVPGPDVVFEITDNSKFARVLSPSDDRFTALMGPFDVKGWSH